MNKKLLFLTARLPYPPITGRKNVMYYYCLYLHQKYGFEIINVSFLEKDDDLSKKPDFIKKTYELKEPSIREKLKNLLIDTIIRRRFPMQVSLFFDKNIKNEIDEIINNEKPDIIMCDMIRTSEYLKDYNIKKILDMDDMLSLRYMRQLETDLENVNPYGAFLYTFPSIIQKALLFQPLKRVVLKTETKLIEGYEKNISENYDAVVFVAQKEADELNKRTSCKKAFAVPLGVNIDYFSNFKKSKRIKKSISFLGAMNVAHNETAVLYFCKEVLPLIIKEINDVKFFIVGGGVTEKIRELESENIIVTGRVDDVREYVSKTQVFVCPLRFGSGIKTKNLEAMAMGVPVVTTSVGAESINAVDEVEWIVRDNIELFKDAVVSILESEELQEQLSSNGYRFVSENFAWDIVMEKWDDVFKFIDNNNKSH